MLQKHTSNSKPIISNMKNTSPPSPEDKKEIEVTTLCIGLACICIRLYQCAHKNLTKVYCKAYADITYGYSSPPLAD
jgi:hypothetical protein